MRVRAVEDFAAEIEDDGGVGLGGIGELGGGKVGHAELGSEAGGLLLHVLDEFGALDALGPAGKVFHQGGDGELTAGLVAFQHQGLEIGTRGVDGCGQAGAAGAEDDEIAGFYGRCARGGGHGLRTV